MAKMKPPSSKGAALKGVNLGQSVIGSNAAFTEGGKRDMMRNILRQKVRSRMQKDPAFPRPVSGTEGVRSAEGGLGVTAPLPPEVKKR